MKLWRCILLMFPLALGLQANVQAQVYYPGEVIHSGPIYSMPAPVVYESVPMSTVVHPAPVVSSATSVCNSCGGSSHGPCNCKHLNCEIQLPHGCKSTGPTQKTPIPCEIVGTIPKRNIEKDCYTDLDIKFPYPTKVPEIHCTTETCTEIGKKSIQCVPGCSFSVCIPINHCTKKTVECKLVFKTMTHRIRGRNDPHHGLVYDVFVINDPNPASPGHAGGMPKEWLVVHCGKASQIQKKFPDAKKADGTPLVKKPGKYKKSQPTEADVDIEMIVKEALVREYMQAEAKAGSDGSDLTSAPTAGPARQQENAAEISATILAATNRKP